VAAWSMERVSRVAGVLLCGVAIGWCGCRSIAASPTVSSQSPRRGISVRLTAEPERVGAGAPLTYTVVFAPTEVAPPLTLHLPAGTAEAKVSGAGWTCTVAKREADSYQADAHFDAECSSMLVSLGPRRLTVGVKAPTAPGSIRACVVAGSRGGREGDVACVDSTVVP
jgi:hypothetical protein